MKKTRNIFILIILIIMFLFVNRTYANELDITSESAVLIDSQTGQILYQKNMNIQRAMASTSKLMTYLLVMESIDREEINYNDKVKVSLNASKTGGSSYNLKVNDILTVEELVNSMLIISANDSAVVLAEYVGGSINNFAKMMNQRASSLGLESAYFINPSGMPLENNEEQNKISAIDLAYLSKYILNNYEKHILNITNKKQFTGTYKNFVKKSTNDLVINTTYVEGLKTGYTGLAKYCLVSTVNVNDNRLISVVLGSKTLQDRTSDSKKVLDYGLNNFTLQMILKKGEVINSTKEINNIPTPLELIVKDDITLFTSNNIDLSKDKQIVFNEVTESVLEDGVINGVLKLNNGINLPIQLEVKKVVSILINDKPLFYGDNYPFIQNNTTYVPLKLIAEEIGLELKWEGKYKTVVISKEELDMKIFVEQDVIFVNNSIIKMKNTPMIVNGITMIPLREFVQYLNMEVVWDKNNNTIDLYSN